MISILHDARMALRTLFKQPGFAFIAIVTLALGIGANTAIFSLVNTVLLQPLPYPGADQLVRIWSSNPTDGRERYFTSPLSYFEWVDGTETFDEIAAAWPREVTLTDAVDEPQRIRTFSSTVNWFETLGVVPLLGRTFRPEDAQIQWGSWILILSYGLWQDRFGGDSTVIGTTVRIEGQPAEIIGVLRPGDAYPESIDLFTNFLPPRTQNAQYMDVIARLRPAVDIKSARADLAGVARGLQDEFPQTLTNWGVDMVPLRDVVVGDVRTALLVLMGATGLVLVIACANVANLLLARTEKRFKEMAIRAALGAERRRLVRQLLTESVVLGGLGALTGLAVAIAGLRLLMGMYPTTLPRFTGVGLDLTVLGIAMASAVLTGLAFGLAPAVQLLRADLHADLKEGGQRTTAGRSGGLLRDTFVVTQLALALIVSIGAGLLIKSFANLRETDPGFAPSGILTFTLNLPQTDYPDLTVAIDTYGRLLDELRAVPGVQHAGITSSLPLSDPLDYLLRIVPIGEAPPEPGNEPNAWYRQVSPGFLEALGISVVRGRAFDDRDRADAPAVVIVNRTLARTLFGDQDPIGRRLSGVSGGFGPLGRVQNAQTEIVGVVDDVRYGSLRDPAAPSLYFPYAQAPFRLMTIAVRTSGDPSAALGPARRVVSEIDPNLPLGNVSTMMDVVEQSLARDRFAMFLVSLFGVIALLLATVGIYGVLSYTVAQRTSELGLRIALGARSPDVLGLVMRRSAILIGIGVLIGTAGALVVTGAIASQLFGVATRDPLTYGAVALLLGAVGALASYIPAVRATRVSPLTALKHE